ncbi:hypothetical protein TRFO_39889 [Tritrichomonas foetus]|uniref:Uncharacterized protein n=1 Tax=Tritrichomonas foetus TaxID=1144522 RepID=A0A1J4J3A8_9EUKA|nr:hypothetical protein TRFO_39889 [Tritrichomonas foetus]|eukprot:OHS93936.1 hypothetical protein TRFO_39889 [Tritrichomonas foetus]
MSNELPPYARALQNRKMRDTRFTKNDYDERAFPKYQLQRNNNANYNNYQDPYARRQDRYYDDDYVQKPQQFYEDRPRQPTRRRGSDFNDEIKTRRNEARQQHKQMKAPRKMSQNDDCNNSYSSMMSENRSNDENSFSKMSQNSQVSSTQVQQTKELYPDLRSTVDELQQKNRELLNEISMLKNMNTDNEICELRVQLQTQKNRNAQLFQDLQKAENAAADAKQLISMKDTTIQSVQDECQKLRIDYQDLLTTVKLQNDQISQLNRRNRELEAELEKTRLAQPYMSAYKPVLINEPFDSFPNNNNNMSNNIYNDPIDNGIDAGNVGAQKNFDDNFNSIPTKPPHIGGASSTTSIQLINTKGNIHPAMKDNLNINFGDNEQKACDINVKVMNNVELRQQYESYLKKKESKEWLLSRAPPKGANKSHVRQEKEKLSDECDELARIVSKLKLELKLRGIY